MPSGMSESVSTVQEGERIVSGQEQTAQAWRRSEHYRAALLRESRRGTEVRRALLDVAQALDIDLTSEVRGDRVWSPENMARVTERVQSMKYELDRTKGRHVSFTGMPVAVRPLSADLAAQAMTRVLDRPVW